MSLFFERLTICVGTNASNLSIPPNLNPHNGSYVIALKRPPVMKLLYLSQQYWLVNVWKKPGLSDEMSRVKREISNVQLEREEKL